MSHKGSDKIVSLRVCLLYVNQLPTLELHYIIVLDGRALEPKLIKWCFINRVLRDIPYQMDYISCCNWIDLRKFTKYVWWLSVEKKSLIFRIWNFIQISNDSDDFVDHSSVNDDKLFARLIYSNDIYKYNKEAFPSECLIMNAQQKLRANLSDWVRGVRKNGSIRSIAWVKFTPDWTVILQTSNSDLPLAFLARRLSQNSYYRTSCSLKKCKFPLLHLVLHSCPSSSWVSSQ